MLAHRKSFTDMQQPSSMSKKFHFNFSQICKPSPWEDNSCQLAAPWFMHPQIPPSLGGLGTVPRQYHHQVASDLYVHSGSPYKEWV